MGSRRSRLVCLAEKKQNYEKRVGSTGSSVVLLDKAREEFSLGKLPVRQDIRQDTREILRKEGNTVDVKATSRH